MMETKLEVPAPVRELVAISIDNAEKALALFFDAATRLITPASAESLALLKRVIAVKIDYARKVALARDIRKPRHYNSLIAEHKSKSRLILFEQFRIRSLSRRLCSIIKPRTDAPNNAHESFN